MKNIQFIDDSVNCNYDIFEIDDSAFEKIFPDGTDVEFEDDFLKRCGNAQGSDLLATLWKERIDKKAVNGIHGTLFFGYCCEEKRPFYPTKKESEMIANPG